MDSAALADLLDLLRSKGVTHYEGPSGSGDVHIDLGYPWGAQSAPVAPRAASDVSTSPPGEHAADLVLNPPDLSKVIEDK